MTRAEVWRFLGAPDEQVGSVNEPRVAQEHGFAWNEKWLHRAAAGRSERVVLWNRYDLVGIFEVDTDGAWQPLALPEA